MLFDTTAPVQNYTPGKNYANNPWLKYLGYNQNGSENTLGQVESYIPGINVGRNLIAQDITKGTDTNQPVKADFKNNLQKFLTEAGIAATVLTGGAAAPVLGAGIGEAGAVGGAAGAATIGDAVGSAGALGGAASTALPDLTSTALPNIGQGTGWADVLKKQGLQLAQNIGNNASNQPAGNNQPQGYSLQNYNNIS